MSEMSGAKRGRVLIVDDDELSRETLADLLEIEGYQLDLAENGYAALESARLHHPDLVLLDVMMPDMSGYEVCHQLRREPLLAEVPVILVTALDDHASKVQGLDAGADDFVSKPYDRVELRMRVRNILKLNRFRRLLAERDKLAWVIEHSGEAYIMLNAAGRMTYCNDNALEYLRCRELDTDANFFDLVRCNYQCMPEAVWEHWPHTSSSEHAYLVRPESNEEHALWLQVDTWLPRRHGGEDILVRLRDVTSQIERLRQVWTFHGLISHKLRTPLTGLKAIQLVRKQLESQLDPAMAQLLGMAEYSAQRLERHLTDVLHYIHTPRLLVAGKNALEISEITGLVEEIAQELEIRATVEIAAELAQRSLPLNLGALKSLFQATLDNSKKFHPQHTPQVEIRLTPTEQPDTLCLQIQDDGRWVRTESFEQLWSPYYQDEKVFTGEVPGTGLGLAGVALVVWSTGGQCGARNREERPGFVVELILPLMPRA